jgi:hypothetical protein
VISTDSDGALHVCLEDVDEVGRVHYLAKDNRPMVLLSGQITGLRRFGLLPVSALIRKTSFQRRRMRAPQP